MDQIAPDKVRCERRRTRKAEGPPQPTFPGYWAQDDYNEIFLKKGGGGICNLKQLLGICFPKYTTG